MKLKHIEALSGHFQHVWKNACVNNIKHNITYITYVTLLYSRAKTRGITLCTIQYIQD